MNEQTDMCQCSLLEYALSGSYKTTPPPPYHPLSPCGGSYFLVHPHRLGAVGLVAFNRLSFFFFLCTL